MPSVVYISATIALESLLLVFMHVAELHIIYIMGIDTCKASAAGSLHNIIIT